LSRRGDSPGAVCCTAYLLPTSPRKKRGEIWATLWFFALYKKYGCLASAQGDYGGVPPRDVDRDLLIADSHVLFTPDIFAGCEVA
jgi:hypothetical protein